MAHTWTGVFPAITTKFTDNQMLDRDETAKGIALQLDAGVDGIICCGTLGESSTLSINEKVDVVKTALEVSNGRVPVLATISETSTKRARELLEKAQKAGADGFMVLPGMIYPADVREAVAHYKAVAEVADKPMMIYNNPISYRVDLGMEGLEALAEDPKFVAIKESSDDIRRTTTIRNRFGDRFDLFTGVDNLALESLMMGADGWVAGLVCAFPKETVAIYKLAKMGRFEEAREIYRWFVPLLELDVSTKLVQNIKLAEKLVYGFNDTVRAPRLSLIGDELARVTKVIKDAVACRPTLPKL